MSSDDLYYKLKKKFDSYKSNLDDWYEKAEEAYDLYHGNQWKECDKRALECKGRPYLTFNQIQPLINAVIGSEINNRRVIKFLPREIGDVKPNELLTSVSTWFREETSGEVIDTSIFKDSLITGMGWGEVTLDYDDNISGKPCIRRLDPLKMVWDTNSRLDNLEDANYLFFINSLPIDDLKDMFPDVDESEFQFGLDDRDKVIETEYELKANTSKPSYGTIVEARYKKLEKYVTYFDILEQTEKTIPHKEFMDRSKELQTLYGVTLEGVVFNKKVVHRAYLGKTKLLEEVGKPLSPDNNFGWLCLTAYYDNINKYYYGLIKALKDSQLCINKFFSEAVYNFNTQGKGGLFVEKGAVENLNEFKSTVNFVDELTVLENGGLQKIQPKPVGQLSPVMSSLISFAEGQISRVTGVSQEFLGTREVNQAGILEAHRKQSSLNILAPLFDNLKMYRKRQGEVILYLIQNYLSDGRLVRILGKDKEQYVPLLKEAIADIEYDIIVDDEPLTLNDSERSFQVITQLMPMIQQYLTPEIMLQIMKHSPLPSELIDGIAAAYQTNQQQAQQAQQMQQQQMQQVQAQQQAIIQRQVQKQDIKDNLENQVKQVEIGKISAQAEKERALALKEKTLAEQHQLNVIEDMN